MLSGFRLIDIFVLRLDERLGEIILSKIQGFGLVVCFLWAIGKKLMSIGFHGRRLGENLLIYLELVWGYAYLKTDNLWTV